MRRFFIFLFIYLFIFSCGGESKEDTSDIVDVSDVLEQDTGENGEISLDVSETKVATEPENYKIVFGYKGRIYGVNDTKFDLWVVNPDGSDKINLTEASLSKLGLNCDYGCIVDDKLHWIAVSPSPPDQNGTFSVKIGKINENFEVFLHKAGTLTGIVDLKFVGDRMFYSTIKSCEFGNTKCQYEIKYIDLEKDVTNVHVVGIFPPDSDPDFIHGDSNYHGHFTVSPDGNSVIVLSTTIRSVRVYVAKNGLIQELDYICQEYHQGMCTGTGSWYFDTDPVAISHDSKYAVFLTKAYKSFLIRLYNLENFQDKRWSTIIKLPEGSNGTIADKSLVCANKKPWQFISIPQYSKPIFTKDNQYVVIPGFSDCDPDGRPETNLYKININDIGDGTPLEENEVVKLIKKPEDNSIYNIIIQNFAFSPEFKWIVLSASPMYQENGQLIPEGSSRGKNDREVYVLDPKTFEYKQITNSVDFMVTSIFTIKVSGNQ